ELYVIPSGQDDRGEEFLGGETLTSYSEARVIVLNKTDDGLCDIKAVDTDGDSYFFESVPLSDNASLSLELRVGAGGFLATVTPENGDSVSVQGTLETGDSDKGADTDVEETVAMPTANDPLDTSVAMPGFESLVIPYPSTMKVAKTNDSSCFVQLDAVNDTNNNGISFNLIALQGTYEERLNSNSTAKDTMVEIGGKVCDQTFPGMLIQNIGTEFSDGGTYYAALSYLWMSGAVFEENSSTPVRGVLECRYYGTDYILAVFTLADEGAIQRYFDISRNIFDSISRNSTWSTPDDSNTAASWSDPGDYDYDPWSDPGDYDYDPWSDPGDYDYDPWSDPGDYYDGDYTDGSDPGDYYDGDYTDGTDPGDYYDDNYGY
ncbi:MAG: hypothetical protein AB7D36_10920, partial [Oscillospiraceae bacterium]